MTIIASIDGPTRRIYLHADTVGASIDPIDIYRESRILRGNTEELRKYDNFTEMRGYEAKGGGKFTERYMVLMLGTRIVPFDVTHTISITGTLITDDGLEGIAAFDQAPLNPSSAVSINYIPPQVEVIEVNTGSGVSPQDIIDISTAVWNFATSSMIDVDSIGYYITNKLLTIKKWLGLK